MNVYFSLQPGPSEPTLPRELEGEGMAPEVSAYKYILDKLQLHQCDPLGVVLHGAVGNDGS